MRGKFFGVLSPVALWIVASAPTVLAEGYVTRIEPRPFYGAVVTLEEGVRVIRPLPPERHVIINPDNKTPLSLSFNETHVSEHRVIENRNGGAAGGESAPVIYGRGAGLYGGFSAGRGDFGHMGHHHNGHHGHGAGGISPHH